MVNQGVGSYADSGNLLARGKDTEVRFFLVTSTDVGALCSGSISVRSANLTVTNTAGTSYATPALQTFGTSGTLIPSSILSVDSNADPKFVLPAANANSCVTTPCADTGGFSLTFSAAITYTTSLQSASQTITATTAAGFDRASNALRVLAIPMGDASQAYATQFSDSARVAVENGFAALSRIYPLPGGVSSTLATNVGGLRYKLDLATMLNLRGITGAYDGNGKFCGTQANFDAGIKSQLAGYLTVYNGSVRDPAFAADRVMGVVDKAISDGSTSTFNCAEAMASTVSPEMWVRAIPDQAASGRTPAVPSMTGGLMAMEMSHTFNMDVTASFHSTNTQADTTAPERAYNISSRSYLSDDRSTMRFVSTAPFNNNNALFERDDYEHMLCNLGGSLTILPGTAVACPTTPSTQSVGTVVAAGPTFAIFGTSDLKTQDGTHVLESYKGDNGDPVFQTSNGLLALKFYGVNGAQVGTDVKVPFSAQTSDHDSAGLVNTTNAVFGGLFDAPAGYARADLVYGNIVLYTRTSRPLDPVSAGIGSVSPGGSLTIKKTLTTPAIPPQPDIIFLSDTTGSMDGAIGNVKANVAAIVTSVKQAQPNAQFGVANYKDFGNGCDYAYRLDQSFTGDPNLVQNGVNTWTAGCGGDTEEADFWALHQLATGDPSVVWPSGSSKIVVWIGDAPSHPSTGPDSEHQATQESVIAELKAAGIRVIAVNVGGLDSAGQATAITDATGGVLTTSDPNQVSSAILAGLQNLPAAVTPQVVSCDGLTIGFDAGSKTVPSGSPVSFTETANIAAAAAPGSTVACTVNFLVNGLPVSDPSFTEVVSLKVSGDRAIVATFETPNPDALRAHVIYDCGNGEKEPALVGLEATQVSTNIAQFQANVDPSLSCANAGGTASLQIVGTNGVDAVTQTIDTSPATLPVTDKPPSAAIYQPTLDASLPYTSQFSLNGHVADPEDGNLEAHWTILSGPVTPAIAGRTDVIDVPPPTAAGWPGGDYVIQLSGTDSHGHTSTATTTVHVVHYSFSGFLQPVDSPPTVNVGKAGKTYPVKWTLTQNGVAVVDLGAIESLKFGSAPCGTAPADTLETTATGGTSLRFDAGAGQYIYNWQTPSAAGCYVLLLTLGDGSIWPAYFKLT